MSELKLLPCPFCGGEAKVTTRDVEPQGDPWYGANMQTFVVCTKCGACLFDECFHEGFADEREAIATWNRRTQPDQLPAATKLMPNVPLTIDDITDLGYEPIWVEDISGCNTSCWAIAGRTRGSGIELYDEHCGEHYIDFAAWDNYGKTWVAYRRNPEPEGGDHHA